VLDVLAEALAVPRSAVRLLRGDTTPDKWVEIDGLADVDELRRRIG